MERGEFKKLRVFRDTMGLKCLLMSKSHSDDTRQVKYEIELRRLASEKLRIQNAVLQDSDVFDRAERTKVR